MRWPDSDREGRGLATNPYQKSLAIPALVFALALLVSAGIWFYVDEILKPDQIADSAEHNRPRGNLSDLFPRWLGARELLLHGRNPYSREITVEIQQGYYGRALDPASPGDPKDEQAFAYPVYVVFLLAPTVWFPFALVQTAFGIVLIALSIAGVWFWLMVLRWKLSFGEAAVCVVLLLGSFPEVQGLKLQQLTLLVAALLAAGAASVAAGYFALGGAVIALATIKPQLALPLIVWLLAWTVSDWKIRKHFATGFLTVMGLLLAGSELVLPGWLRMFWEAMHEYHRYTASQSVLDPLVSWALGPWGGSALGGIGILAAGALLWRSRRDESDSENFGRSIALVMALTVFIIPMNSPYNQVLLLPSILLLVKERKRLTSTVPERIGFLAGGTAFAWPWLCGSVLFCGWWVARLWARQAWKLPLYSTFALPVLVFLLCLYCVRQQVVLRARDATR